MKVLLTGATGFLGRYLLAALLRAGHEVTPAVRDTAAADALLPEPGAVHVDFNHAVDPSNWAPHLKGVDAVINCAGILQSRPHQSIESIHAAAPIALFEAAHAAGIRRVVQVSAISAQSGADTAFARTKRAADTHLRNMDLDWVILKPSLIYGAGAYGGTALMRGLSALPWLVPLVGAGRQAFRPIYMNDFCDVVVEALQGDTYSGKTLVLVGPDQVSLRDVLGDLRRWLGIPVGRYVAVPLPLIAALARLGDVFGGTINTTALRQLEFGNEGADLAPGEEILVTDTPWHEGLARTPSQIQDRWHARLYFLRPLLRWIIGLTWIASGIIGLGQDVAVVEQAIQHYGLGGEASRLLFTAACLADLAIGAGVLARWKPGLLATVQISVIALYTAALSITIPELWRDPFGPLMKNFPFAAAILALAAIERER